MASRWAYEAMAVTQFKDNEYEKIFYEFDKEMSFANWKKDQWISNLESKLNIIKRHTEKDTELDERKTKEVQRQLTILKNELEKELRNTSSDCKEAGICEALQHLTLGKFNEDTYYNIDNYLKIIKKGYMLTYNQFEKKKDEVQRTFTKPSSSFIKMIDKKLASNSINKQQHNSMKKLMGRIKDESFNQFKQQFKNKALEDFVTNSNTMTFTDEDEFNVIQKKDPVYLDPYDFDYFKAHFYAPKKKIFGVYIDTFYANLIVIWLMTILLIVTLYYDILKWMIDSFSNIQRVFSFLKLGKKKQS